VLSPAGFLTRVKGGFHRFFTAWAMGYLPPITTRVGEYIKPPPFEEKLLILNIKSFFKGYPPSRSKYDYKPSFKNHKHSPRIDYNTLLGLVASWRPSNWLPFFVLVF